MRENEFTRRQRRLNSYISKCEQDETRRVQTDECKKFDELTKYLRGA